MARRRTVPITRGQLITALLMGAALTYHIPIASAQAPLPPLAPYPLPPKAAAAVAALAARSDVLILGELHGTQEVPEMAASLLPELDKSGYHVIALEVYADQQGSLADWAMGKSSQIPTFYNGPHDDGRGNEQMLTLVHTALAAPYHWQVICFDISGSRPGDTWRMRDAGMARNFSVQWQRLAPNAKVLAICGNLHARTSNHTTPGDHLGDLWPSFAADLQYAYPHKRVHSIDVEPQRGGFFNGGQINSLSGVLLSEAKTRHRPTDDWDLELGLPSATPATFLTPNVDHATSLSPLTGLRIEAVIITGNSRIPTADIQRAMQSRPGRIFSFPTLLADVNAVYALADFEGVGPFDVRENAAWRRCYHAACPRKPTPLYPGLKAALFRSVNMSDDCVG